MKYTKQDFFAGKIGCRCETKEEYDRLMRECEAKGLRWVCGGEKPTEWKGGYDLYWKSSGQYVRDRQLINGHREGKNAIPFSALFPLDPWAEFCAGRCYLRVTKDEWPEFAKRCEAAGIKWPDVLGSDPANGVYPPKISALNKRPMAFPDDALTFVDDDPSWPGTLNSTWSERTDKPIHPFSAIARPEAEPAPYDGRGKHKKGDRFEVIATSNGQRGFFKVGTIVELFIDDGTINPWFKGVNLDETWAVNWNRLKPVAKPFPRIEITTDGKTTTATLYEGDKAVKTGAATCGPEDKFNFDYSATMALNRMRFGQDFNTPTIMDMRTLSRKARALADEIKGVVGA